MAYFNITKVKKLIIFIISFILIAILPFIDVFSLKTSALTGELSLWRSNESEVGRWHSIPTVVFVTKLNSNDDFYFYPGMSSGICKWANALNVSITSSYTPDLTTYPIQYFGHCLGWKGHSNYASDIMFPSGSTITTLTQVEVEHLKQIYDLS